MAVQRDPIREWREQYARTSLRVDFEPLDGASFHASAQPVAGDLPVLRVDLSPGSLFRDEELARDGEDVIGFFIAQSQDLHFAHLNREMRLQRGDATMMRADTTSAVACGKDFGFQLVLVGAADLKARIAHPHDGLMRRLPRHSEALKLLRGYLRALETSRFKGSAESRTMIRGHITDLVALAVTQPQTVDENRLGESEVSAVVAARVAAVLDEISASFQQPDLTVESVARTLKISPRYLHRLMETTGTSFTERVRELRLQRAFFLLSQARNDRLRISDIAFTVGFSDLSHFNRLFRARFGETPSGVRTQAARRDGGTRGSGA